MYQPNYHVRLNSINLKANPTNRTCFAKVALQPSQIFAFPKTEARKKSFPLSHFLPADCGGVQQEVEKSDPKNFNCLPAGTRFVCFDGFATMPASRRQGFGPHKSGHSQITTLIWPEISNILTWRHCIELRGGGEDRKRVFIQFFYEKKGFYLWHLDTIQRHKMYVHERKNKQKGYTIKTAKRISMLRLKKATSGRRKQGGFLQQFLVIFFPSMSRILNWRFKLTLRCEGIVENGIQRQLKPVFRT